MNQLNYFTSKKSAKSVKPAKSVKKSVKSVKSVKKSVKPAKSVKKSVKPAKSIKKSDKKPTKKPTDSELYKQLIRDFKDGNYGDLYEPYDVKEDRVINNKSKEFSDIPKQMIELFFDKKYKFSGLIYEEWRHKINGKIHKLLSLLVYKKEKPICKNDVMSILKIIPLKSSCCMYILPHPFFIRSMKTVLDDYVPKDIKQPLDDESYHLIHNIIEYDMKRLSTSASLLSQKHNNYIQPFHLHNASMLLDEIIVPISYHPLSRIKQMIPYKICEIKNKNVTEQLTVFINAFVKELVSIARRVRSNVKDKITIDHLRVANRRLLGGSLHRNANSAAEIFIRSKETSDFIYDFDHKNELEKDAIVWLGEVVFYLLDEIFEYKDLDIQKFHLILNEDEDFSELRKKLNVYVSL